MKRFFLAWMVLAPALLAAGCGNKVTNPGGGGGGNNNFGWNRQVPPTTNDLLSVSFADSLHGWAVGVFVIVHTSDGGKTWVDQTQNAMRTTVQFNGVAAADSLHAWAIGADGSIQATSNGGQSWLLQTITAGTIYNGVCFTDTLSGWACGRFSGGLGYAAYTNNGGHLWLPATTTGLHEMRAISFPKGSPFTGVTAGVLGEIALSQDGGHSFARVPAPTTQQLQAIAMAPGSGGQFAVAGGVPGIGSALVTSDGGADWITTQTLIGGMEVLGATMAGPNAAWLVGHQQGHAVAMGSLDGGRTWLTQPVNWNLPLNGVSFPDPLHGWTVGDGGAIFYTASGGQ